MLVRTRNTVFIDDTPPATSSPYPTDGLLLYLKFDSATSSSQTILDQVGSNDLTFAESLTFINNHADVADSALQGGIGQAEMGDTNLALFPTITGVTELSVACWVLNGTNTKGYWCISYVPGTTSDWGLYDYDNVLYCSINPGTPDNLILANPFPAGWTHAVITRDSSNLSTAYVNGLTAFTYSNDDSEMNPNQYLTFGNMVPDTLGYDWTNTMGISGFMLYDRCLTPSEVTQIYENT